MTTNQSLRDPPGRARRRVGPQVELEEPILAELFSVERLEQHARTLAAADTVTDAPRRGHAVGPRVADNGRVLLESYRVLARAIKDERCDHAGRRMARRQLPDRRRAAPRDPRRPAAGLLPRAAQAGRRPSRRLSAGARPRLGVHRPHRQPLRPGEPAAHGARLPGGGAADDRRAVGDRDQPAHPARRQPPPSRRADRARPGGAADRPTSSPTACSAWARRPGRRGGRRCGGCRGRRSRRRPASSSSSACATRIRRSPRPCAGWRSLLAEQGTTAEEMVRARAPAPGDDERDGPQRDHEHAPHLVVRLGAVRREREPRRRRPARAEPRSARWTSRRATATATRSRSWPASPGLTEVEIARRAVALAGGPPAGTCGCSDAGAGSPGGSPAGRPVADGSPARREPGYYLISDGRPAFERDLGVRVPLDHSAAARLRPRRVRRLPGDHRPPRGARPRAVHPAVRVVGEAGGAGTAGVGLILVALLALGPASDLAIALVNRSVTDRARPATAAAARPRRGRADPAADARRRADAPHERGRRRGPGRRAGGPLPGQPRGRPAVRPALGLARRADRAGPRRRRAALGGRGRGIDRLNERHGEAPGGGARFLLFHRRRTWNEVEGCWMGWERKRGKLQELNALLRGSTTTSILTSGRAASTPPAGRALRGHPRRRHAAAPGRGGSPRRRRSPIRSTSRCSIRGSAG